jgi:hypothetical protein
MREILNSDDFLAKYANQHILEKYEPKICSRRPPSKKDWITRLIYLFLIQNNTGRYNYYFNDDQRGIISRKCFNYYSSKPLSHMTSQLSGSSLGMPSTKYMFLLLF